MLSPESAARASVEAAGALTAQAVALPPAEQAAEGLAVEPPSLAGLVEEEPGAEPPSEVAREEEE
jgi:hypothetical protein